MAVDLHIVSWTGLPDGSPDDRALRAALASRGVEAAIVGWDDPAVDWAAARTSVLRSTWNYHLQPDAFVAWLERVAPLTRLVNDSAVVRWNMRKTYLADLEARGVAVVPTVFVGPGEAASLAAIRAERGWGDLVVKPVVGASAHGAARFGANEGEHHLAALATAGGAMVQPFLPEVGRARERCLHFYGGRFSHAYTKRPFNSATGGVAGDERPHEPAPEELRLAQACLVAAPAQPTVARVDMVPTDSGPLLMELELIEPALCLHLAPGSAGRLADAVLMGTGRQGNGATVTTA